VGKKQSQGAAKLREATSPAKPRMTQTDLAEKLGVTPQAVSAWIHGRAMPTPEKMAEIERLLGISMQEWVTPAAGAASARGRKTARPPVSRTGTDG
jgi:transcriptional regulator with XRE-family HTH domain